MKTLVIISTEFSSGKGGIQSALDAYCDGFEQTKVNYIVINSHNKKDILQLSWFIALMQVIKLSFRFRGGDAIFWFHCGPWLSLFRKFLLAWIPKLAGCPTYAHLHSYSLKRYMSGYFSRKLVSIALLPYTSLIVVTPWWKNYLNSYNLTKNILVSANPCSQSYYLLAKNNLKTINSTELKVLKPEIASNKKISLLSLGRLVAGKGFRKLLNAVPLLPKEFSLTIAGEGELRKDLESQVKTLGIENRVTFLGWVSGDEKQNVLENADIFCLLTQNDSFCMGYIEAMACNLPIVALDFSPTNSIVTTDVGMLCSNSSASKIAVTIETVYERKLCFNGKGPKQVIDLYSPFEAALRVKRLLIN